MSLPQMFLRTGSRAVKQSLKKIPRSRRMHQAALATSEPQPQSHPPMVPVDTATPLSVGRGRKWRAAGGLAVREGVKDLSPENELERRIEALQVAVTEEETSLLPPFFSEDDLKFLYEDLLAIPHKSSTPAADPDPVALEQQQAEQDVQIVLEAERRLLQDYPEICSQVAAATQQDLTQSELRAYRSTLSRAQAVISQVEEMRGLVMRGSDSEGRPVAGPSQISVPIAVLSLKECEALIRICTKVQDGPGALLTLELMKRSGMSIPEEAVTGALEILASAGDVKASESLITNFISIPTERQRHLHVKAHLKSTPPNALPITALDVLHAYEEKALFAPISTYTSCILVLIFSRSSVGRAQGWDLFSHMRYVAHPVPDAWLYSLMIRACAFPLSTSVTSEPERALDLWTEMTVDKKLEPSIAAYNAVILACARSGEKMYVNEAFRLAKEMLDAHRDARGESAFRPDKDTFCALLEGAKRLGDLTRARWILAELIRGGTSGMDVGGNENGEMHIDHHLMKHVFQAYAHYKIPFKREATLVSQVGDVTEKEKDSSVVETSISSPADIDAEAGSEEPMSLALNSIPAFSHITPQTSEEVLREATFLFQRILHDTGVLTTPSDQNHYSSTLAGKFSEVQLTSPLVNAYIAVFYRHAPLGLAEKMFWKVFAQLNVPITERVYLDALERCAHVKAGNERDVAIKFSDKLWIEWKKLEDKLHAGGKGRFIERAYSARIRTCAINGDVNQALHVVHSFVQRYPPVSVRTPSEKLHLRSTRTLLVGGSRPLVRMTSAAEVPDDAVPPLLMFEDLELLHHRLVEFGRVKALGYLKWVAKSYEWMLRVRRDENFKQRPVKPARESRA